MSERKKGKNGHRTWTWQRLTVRISGILLLLLALILVIIRFEPVEPGISRVQAFKAAALLLTDADSCKNGEGNESHFPEKEQSNWYVPYMDYLYDHGALKEELTPPSAKEVQKEITYEEVKQLIRAISKKQGELVPATRRNRRKPFPKELWWEFFDSCVREQSDMRTVEAILCGTTSTAALEDTPFWTCFTTGGTFGYEGLAVDAYLDRRIRMYVKGSEIAGISLVLEENPVYENVWTESVENGMVTVHVGGISRTLALPEKTGEAGPAESGSDDPLLHQIVDLHMRAGGLEKLVVKDERITGRVLTVGDDFVEIEGYGKLELAPDFRVYKIYGDYEEQSKKDILIGYGIQEFVASGGRLCAALTVRPFEASRIRVLLMDSGFKSIFHEELAFTALEDMTLSYGKKEKRIKNGETLTLNRESELLAEGRVQVRALEGSGAFRVDSISRTQGIPVYGGNLEIRLEEEGLVLINDLPLEDYLKKVVPSEMPSSSPLEALKAQAICARTYACRQLSSGYYSAYGANVDDSTNYQVYNNIEADENTARAVDETSGQVLMYGDQLAEAYYYSTSCGHGTDGSVWGGESDTPYLQSVEIRKRRETLDLRSDSAFREYITNPDIPAFDSGYAMYRWNALYKGSTLGGKLGLSAVDRIEVKKRGPGGIVKELLLTDVDGNTKSYETQMEVRRALGSEELEINQKSGKIVTGWSLLPSAFIYIEESGIARDGSKLFMIYGGGYGHGVGMSQNAAQAMAKDGMSAADILDFFYRGTQILDQ